MSNPYEVIPVQHAVRHRLAPELEPPEYRARFGTVLFLMGFVLTLPAMGAGTLFSMAIATGQAPVWPTIGEGIFAFAIVLGLLGIWPLLGFLLGFGLRDGARWVLFCLASSGVVPGLFLGGLLVFGEPHAPATDLITMEEALAWMWAVPLLGLLLLRATHTGRRLPPVRAFARMFGSSWRESLPAVQTQWGEVRPGLNRYPLHVPGADFVLPAEALGQLYGSAGAVRVTYDLQHGRIETIEVPPSPLP